MDTTRPTINCASNKVVECGSPWTFDPPTAPADACGTNKVIVLGTVTNALCGNTFSATRTWAAIDACNNTNTCTQTVTVMDTTIPTIACATNKVIILGTSWTFDPPVAPADACGTNRVIILSTFSNTICGNNFTVTRIWAAIDACNNSNTCSQIVTVIDTAPPAVVINAQCSSQIIENGQSAGLSGSITNTGSVGLTNVQVIEVGSGNVLATIPLLAPGATASYSGSYTNTETNCVNHTVTDTIRVVGTNLCNLNQAVSVAASCNFNIACPAICVVKEIACYQGTNAQGAEMCGAFGKSATGVQGDTQNPAFCYRITVTNCGAITLTNIVVIDDRYGDLTTNVFAGLPPVLAPGSSATFAFKADLNVVTIPGAGVLVTNVVTVSAQSGQSGRVVGAQDAAVADIVSAGIAGQQEYSIDGGAPTNCLRLDSDPHNVVTYVLIQNTGSADLMNLMVTGDGLNPCSSVAGPFSVASGTSLLAAVCTNSAYLCTNSVPTLTLAAGQYAYAGGPTCATDLSGEPVLVRAEVQGCVQCTVANAARVTGGGRQDAPLLYPPDARFVTHGGQVGAPVGEHDCVVSTGALTGDPCIHGRWTHVRHAQGGQGGDFHARYFDTLDCACLSTNLGPGGIYGPGTLVHNVCNPGDRVSGPEPAKASANKISFTGVGSWSDAGGRREPQTALFRVDIEDRGEKGGGIDSSLPDRYRIRIWILSDSELAQLNGSGPDSHLLNFRNAISACRGSFVRDGADVPNGTAVFGVRAPDIDDGGAMQRGKEQIHPVVMDCGAGTVATPSDPVPVDPDK
jgi:hypothetical protein